MKRIYLDHNATTRPHESVVEAMTTALRDDWANPSSVHRPGQVARHRVDLAREAIGGLLGARSRDVILTSGGTEADNLALFGVAPASELPLITTKVEHAAVREPAERIEKETQKIKAIADAESEKEVEMIEIEKKIQVRPTWHLISRYAWKHNEEMNE